MRLERMTLALFYEKVSPFYTDISKYQNHRMICTVFSVIKVQCSNQLSYFRIIIFVDLFWREQKISDPDSDVLPIAP